MSIQGPYDVDTLLNDALVQSNQPDNGVIPLANQLRLGNDQLMGILTGRLMSAVQGYYGAVKSVTVTAGTYLYEVPSRAMGAKLRSLVAVNSAGNRWQLANLDITNQESIGRLQPGSPTSFSMVGNNISIWPTPDQTYTLLVGYYTRPGRLVMMDPTATSSPGSRTAVVTAVSGTSLTCNMGYTLNTLFSTTKTIDITRPTAPFSSIVLDASVTAVAASTTGVIATTTDYSSVVQVGDYVNLSGEAGVPQLPNELQPLLVARWALALLKARGDIEQAKSQAQIVADMEADAMDFLSNRVEGEIQSIGRNSLIGSYGVFGAYGGIY